MSENNEQPRPRLTTERLKFFAMSLAQRELARVHGLTGGLGTLATSVAEENAMARELLELRRAVELSGVARLSPSSLPSVLYRPRLSLDGNAWCALYGEDLQVGVAGFGKSPAEAMAAFDAAWVREVQP